MVANCKDCVKRDTAECVNIIFKETREVLEEVECTCGCEAVGFCFICGCPLCGACDECPDCSFVQSDRIDMTDYYEPDYDMDDCLVGEEDFDDEGLDYDEEGYADYGCPDYDEMGYDPYVGDYTYDC